jgi:hypothetical protein
LGTKTDMRRSKKNYLQVKSLLSHTTREIRYCEVSKLREYYANIIKYVSTYPFVWGYAKFKRNRFFTVDEKRFPYLTSPNNSERIIEIPYALRFIKSNNKQNSRVLEIGNILNYYEPFDHDVLDKYEVERGLINQDVVDFLPLHLYDVIISISTLEHVGFDEPQREPEKINKAIINLYDNCLKVGGTMLITFPLGYNPIIDRLVERGHLGLGTMRYMRRSSAFNTWIQVAYEETRNSDGFLKYGSIYPCANILALWEIRK